MDNLKRLNVALLQLMPVGTQEANLHKGLEECRKAKQMNADIALFPEMWNIGYALTQNREETEKSAVSLDSDYVARFVKIARELDMAIGITLLELFEPSPRNSIILIDRHGEIVLHYAKVHTCAFDPTEAQLTAGDDFYVSDLDTESGTVKIGAMICFDREFPESARILMLKGAEIILIPNACPMEINRLAQLRSRAYENMVGIATVNYPHGQPDCNGHSSAFDGIAYRPGDSVSRDTLIVEAGENEGIYIAGFPMDELRDYRSHEVHGNAYRHPDKYYALISNETTEPFIRKYEQGMQANILETERIVFRDNTHADLNEHKTESAQQRPLRDYIKETEDVLRSKGKAAVLDFIDCNRIREQFEQKLIIKKQSAQVNVIIHAYGILLVLSEIMDDDDEIEYLSLGSGSTGKEFDVSTRKMYAEFKFAKWDDGSNTIRQNAFFWNYLELAIKETTKKKYMFCFDIERVMDFLENSERTLESVFSKASRGKKHDGFYGYKTISGFYHKFYNDYPSRQKVEIVNLHRYIDNE